MKLIEKLLNIQNALKAPKGQFNAFGKYKYRSNEDILEAVKPLLAKYKTALVVSDEIVEIGGRVYVKATSTLHDIDSEATLYNTAYAREEETKKGMDGSQITGASSSYARKYSLNGLFLIDDNKDSDSTNMHDNDEESSSEAKKIVKGWVFTSGRYKGKGMLDASTDKDFNEYIEQLKDAGFFKDDIEKEYNKIKHLIKQQEIVEKTI